MPIPDLRHADPVREGITHETIVYDDIVDSLLVEYLDKKAGETRTKLFHEDLLVDISKDIDRYTMTAESRHASRAIQGIDMLIDLLKRQITRLEMLKKRLRDIRAKVNREWQQRERVSP